MDPTKATCLCIVAHPDDETLWGGGNLAISDPDIRWHVVCATHLRGPRAKEFARAMARLGVWSFEMFSCRDVYTEEAEEALPYLEDTAFHARLMELAKRPWRVVLTHNAEGEYGHGGHKGVSTLVRKVFSTHTIRMFSIGKEPLSKSLLDIKRAALQEYPTQTIAVKYAAGKGKELKPIELDYIERETLVVPVIDDPHRTFVPILHQLWIGSRVPSSRKKMMSAVENVARSHGWEYRCWTSKDFTARNFPFSWEKAQESIHFGTDEGYNRWAQVADLIRYELLYRYGGVYLDSAFEIRGDFLPTISELITKKGYWFVGANEDPCNLQCKSGKDKKYLSNGFIACIPKHPAMQILTSPSFYDGIDIKSVYINRTTGPYALRGAIRHPRKERVTVFPYKSVYPAWVNDTERRKGGPNKCIVPKGEKQIQAITFDENRAVLSPCPFYPNSLAIYHSGLGGTWSY